MRVNFDETEDVGIVTHYKGTPFTGIAYNLYENGKLYDEVEMVKGLKHGSSNVYDLKGNQSQKLSYKTDVLHGKQIFFNPDQTVIRESYYENGVFIKASHFDSRGQEIDGFSYVDCNLSGSNLKIRKFGIERVQSFSPRATWLRETWSGFFLHLYLTLVANLVDAKNTLTYGYELKFQDPEVLEDLKKTISKFKLTTPDYYNQVFWDKNTEDIKELSQYKLLLNPSYNAKMIPENTAPAELFKQQYLKIHKGHNIDYKSWVVLDSSLNPTAIVFQSDSQKDCEDWINKWER